MSNIFYEISQIAIYLKDPEQSNERLGEIALFDPLAPRRDKTRKWEELSSNRLSAIKHFPLLRRITLRVQISFFKRCRSCVRKERKSVEARFKTVLSLLLTQEGLREFFLGTEKKRDEFLETLTRVAHESGYHSFSPPSLKQTSPLQLSRELTWIDFIGGSLIEDLAELTLQMSLFRTEEQNTILFKLLNNVKRPPITSVVEVGKKGGEANHEVALTTHFGKYCIYHIEEETGNVRYSSAIDKAKVGHLSTKNTMNQRIALARDRIIGSYCGELITRKNVLEQILFLLDHHTSTPPTEAHILHTLPKDENVTELEILFSSLFTWKEMGKITRQYYAIRSLHGAILKRGDEFYRLNLYFFNIPFSMKLPIPTETNAVLEDLNEECLILFTYKVIKTLYQKKPNQDFANLLCSIEKTLSSIEKTIRYLRTPLTAKEDEQTDELLKSKNQMIDQIDLFRYQKKKWRTSLAAHLESGKSSQEETELLHPLLSLLEPKKRAHTKGMERKMMLGILADKLGILQNTNCPTSTDRTGSVNAADKAQFAYSSIVQSPYLPGVSSHEGSDLYKVLYSLYLTAEEPKITAELGLHEASLHHIFSQSLKKHPEASKFLLPWI